MPGRLLGRVEAYLEAGASEYVLKTIRYGYKLVFENAPPPRDFRPKNKSTLTKLTFLYEELLRLEQLGCTVRVNSRPHIVNPCSIVYSKKWRCVLDASICLNKYCLKRKTKLSDLSSVPLLLRQGDYMTGFTSKGFLLNNLSQMVLDSFAAAACKKLVVMLNG